MRFVLFAVAMLAGCAKTSTVRCGDVTCPAGTHCGPMNECVSNDCGDSIVAGLEECDGDIDAENLRCTDYGFYMGPPLTCSETCTVDTSKCSEFCGDHTINGTERCDGVPATGFACSDFGFDVGTIGCTDACTPGFDFCSNIGWQLVPGGATDELYGLYLASPDSGVAVGRAGTIIAAKDGVWLPVASPTTQDLNAIYGDANNIIAVGNGGTIIRYTGTTVSMMTSPTTTNLRGVSGGALGALAVGDGGMILRYDGTTWTTMTSPVSVRLNAVFAVNALLAYAVGANGTLLKMQGNSWSQLTPANLPTDDLNAVFVVDGVVFVAGANAAIARIVNDTTVTLPPALPTGALSSFTWHTIWAASPTDVFIAGNNGAVLHWNGNYLTRHDTPTSRTIYAMQGSPLGRVVAVTRGGTVLAYNGTSRRVDALTGNNLFAIYTDGMRTVAAGSQTFLRFGADGRWQVTSAPVIMSSIFALGNDVYTGSPLSGLYKSTNGGAIDPTPVSAAGVNAIWGTTSPLRVVAVGDKLIESTDGITFPQTSATTVHGTNTLRGVWAAADGTWFAVGSNGFAMRRGPGDSVWTAIPTGVTNDLASVWGSSASDVFAVGTLGTIVHWNGTRWRRLYTGIAENLFAVSGNTGSDVMVVGTSFTRLHYDGISWSRMAAARETPHMFTHRGTTFYVSSGQIEQLERVHTNTEFRCTDPWDNDSDGLTNCDDPDCKEDPQCRRGGACETLERVTCETTALETDTFTGVARLNDLPCLDHSTPGPEASFRYIALESGSVTVTIQDPSQLLDVVVTEANDGHCALQTCAPATRNGNTLTATFNATVGNMYFIVVDGSVGTGAPFTLSVSCN